MNYLHAIICDERYITRSTCRHLKSLYTTLHEYHSVWVLVWSLWECCWSASWLRWCLLVGPTESPFEQVRIVIHKCQAHLIEHNFLFDLLWVGHQMVGFHGELNRDEFQYWTTILNFYRRKTIANGWSESFALNVHTVHFRGRSQWSVALKRLGAALDRIWTGHTRHKLSNKYAFLRIYLCFNMIKHEHRQSIQEPYIARSSLSASLGSGFSLFLASYTFAIIFGSSVGGRERDLRIWNSNRFKSPFEFDQNGLSREFLMLTLQNGRCSLI